MFRPQANLPRRIVRTVLVPSGPLILTVTIVNLGAISESLGQFILLLSMAWFFCSLILVPALLFRADSSPSSSSDDDGGGTGPPESPPPDPGAGGIPLPDAEQSSQRVRDHVRPKRRWLRRRPAREPERNPRPTLPGPRRTATRGRRFPG